MTTGVFVIQPDGSLSGLEPDPYTSEEVLQTLLAKYPDLLAGDQVDPENPRRWLLVERESGLPDREAGSNRWSLDHLFLDQDGIPTLVEVKLGANTQIRREVVGQMLDYAANAVAFVAGDEIRNRLAARCAREGLDAEEQLRQLLGAEGDPELYWQDVAQNLRTGTIRLVFVADAIPPELRRIVEFLNERMDPTEVLAVEVRRYGKGDLKAVVPRVIGQTIEAENRKSLKGRATREWTEESFFEALAEEGPEAVTAARRLLAWGRATATRMFWGSGAKYGSFMPIHVGGGAVDYYLVAATTYGRAEIQLQHLKIRGPFREAEKRRELVERLNSVPGVKLPLDSIDRRPAFDLALLAPTESWVAFQKVADWFVEEVKKS